MVNGDILFPHVLTHLFAHSDDALYVDFGDVHQSLGHGGFARPEVGMWGGGGVWSGR